jgi:cell wall assembly regulator SMI1
MLSVDLLEQLRARWQQHGADIVSHLQAGLPAETMDELVGPLGLELPAEARVWWGWHDGVDAQLDMGNGEADIGVGLLFFPLEAAVDYHRELRAMVIPELDALHRRFPDRIPAVDAHWPAQWLPFTTFGHGSALALDCSVPEGRPCAIYELDWEDMQAYPAPFAASLGDLVEKAIDAIDRGARFYDRERRRWFTDPEREDTSDWKARPFG